MEMIREFEKASDKLNKENPDCESENVIEWVRNSDKATVCFSQKRTISKLKKLAEQYPEDVEIIAENQSSIVAHIPVSAIKINISKRSMTKEQKEILRDRMKRARESKG